MRCIRKGEVRLNGKRTKPDARTALGQILRVPWEEEAEKVILPKESAKKEKPRSSKGASLPVLYQDEDLLVVNKPWGLLSQPDTKGGDSLITRVWEMVSLRRDFRPVPVHRLDRNTSGILLVALKGSLLRELYALWQGEGISKIYRVIVTGNPGEEGDLREPLRKSEKENRVYVDSRKGVPAHTRYRRLGSHGKYSLLEVELLTGRPHQIRVHLAHRGCPVVGDYKYGDEKINKNVRKRGVCRPLLHAYSLALPPMVSPWELLSERIFTCSPPEDFGHLFAGDFPSYPRMV
jgi:23S rRNA pseudouridine955/2504/2580 synthase